MDVYCIQGGLPAGGVVCKQWPADIPGVSLQATVTRHLSSRCMGNGSTLAKTCLENGQICFPLRIAIYMYSDDWQL